MTDDKIGSYGKNQQCVDFLAFQAMITAHISQWSSNSAVRSTTDVMIVCKGLMRVLIQKGHYEYEASRITP
jgi:hypothetical protein